ncbi:MAG: hypothetical protein ACE5HO_00415 [bacterium]
MRLQIALIAIMLLLSCSRQKPEDILDLDQFTDLYIQLVLQSQYHSAADSLEAQKRILKQFNVTPEELENTIQYLDANPELWLQVFQKASDEFEQLEKKPELTDSKP